MGEKYLEAVVVMGVGLVVVLLIVLFLIPSDKPVEKKAKKKKKKKEAPVEASQETLEFQNKIQHLEGKIRALQSNIDILNKDIENKDKVIVVEQENSKKFEEKLIQERGWQEKELSQSEKKNQELNRMKEDLKVIQENYAKEHSANIRFEKEIKEKRIEIEDLLEKKRKAELEGGQLQLRNDELRQEMAHVKKDNAILKRKQDDTTWVAASQYQKLEQKYKELETEMQRVQRQDKKEAG